MKPEGGAPYITLARVGCRCPALVSMQGHEALHCAKNLNSNEKRHYPNEQNLPG